MDTKTKILIGIPTMGNINTTLVSHIIKWAKDFERGKLGFYFTFKVAPVDRARNEIVEFFFKERKDKNGNAMDPFTHLFFVDSDTLPPQDAIKKLLAHDKDIVSGLTPILHYDGGSEAWGTLDNCFTHQDKDASGKVVKTHAAQRNTGLVEIFRCGGSCMLIKREVFQKMKKPYFKFLYSEDGSKHTKSEDLYFCDMAKEAGFRIYADTSVICNHFKDIML